MGIATGAESEAVRLAAIKDAVDRAGLSARAAVSVAIGPEAWEQVFDDIVTTPTGSPLPAISGPELEPEPTATSAEGAEDATTAESGAPVPDEPPAIVDAEVVEADNNGLLDYAEAVAQAAQVNRALGVFGPVRAISPGRSRR